jgi:hypothetical protein
LPVVGGRSPYWQELALQAAKRRDREGSGKL